MGKIRAKTIGDEEQEQKEKEAAEARRLAKIEAAKAEGKAKKESSAAKAMDDKAQESETESSAAKAPADKTEEKKTSKYAAKQAAKGKQARSEKYLSAVKLIDKNKNYSLKEALDLLDKTHLASFDESVELHINTLTTGINGQITLPHGTGKSTRVAILAPAKDPKAADQLLKDIEAGKMTFDVLVATPDAMPKLAKVAKVLGPKGLMPNPKAGTITPKPEEVAEKFKAGQMNYKTEAKAPIIHVMVGKLSFGKEKLSENIKALLAAIKSENMRKVVVKSTMSPAIKLQVGK